MAVNGRVPGGRDLPPASCQRFTGRADQVTLGVWSRAPQAIWAGDMLTARRVYQPGLEAVTALTP